MKKKPPDLPEATCSKNKSKTHLHPWEFEEPESPAVPVQQKPELLKFGKARSNRVRSDRKCKSERHGMKVIAAFKRDDLRNFETEVVYPIGEHLYYTGWCLVHANTTRTIFRSEFGPEPVAKARCLEVARRMAHFDWTFNPNWDGNYANIRLPKGMAELGAKLRVEMQQWIPPLSQQWTPNPTWHKDGDGWHTGVVRVGEFNTKQRASMGLSEWHVASDWRFILTAKSIGVSTAVRVRFKGPRVNHVESMGPTVTIAKERAEALFQEQWARVMKWAERRIKQNAREAAKEAENRALALAKATG